MMQAFWAKVWQFLKMLNTELPYEPTISLLGVHLRELKTWPHKNCTPMFTTTLFRRAKKVETTQISINWWMEVNVVYPYNGVLFGQKKKKKKEMKYWHTHSNTCESWKLRAKWEEPATKTHYCMIPFMWNVQNR